MTDTSARPSPAATYRLQLRGGVGFPEATAIVPYLARLGVSHVYLSPLFLAEPGSSHGYDVVDPTRVDDALGGDEGLARLWRTLLDHGLRALVDLVPNHVSVVSDRNPWWRDVLRFGRTSAYADWFDVDWDAPSARGRLRLPVLGAPLADVVDELRVEQDDAGWAVRLDDRVWPLAPGTEPMRPVRGDAAARVLDVQHYELCWWRDPLAPNYRRFFDIDGLAGVRVERADVFDAHAALVRRWCRESPSAEVLDGVRVDHVDGLADPLAYLRAMREVVGEDRLLLVEKILHGDEQLPDDWPVDGTTGYEFGDVVSGLLVDPAAAAPLDATLERFVGGAADWEVIVRDARDLVVHQVLGPELDRLSRELEACVADTERRPSVEACASVVGSLLVAFDVYRTYVDERGAEPHDEAPIRFALGRAAADGAVDAELLAQVGSILLDPRRREQLLWVRRFQQTAAAVTAKAVEDTALYRYPRLVSRNEVGADPSQLSRLPEDLYAAARARARWPRSLLATSTHDTKRSEDVRARIAALSLVPDVWARTVEEWSTRARPHHGDSLHDPTLEYLVWQTLVGAWPMSRDRLLDFTRKAAREAKRLTSWYDVDDHYEHHLVAWLHGILGDHELMASIEAFAADVTEAGRIGSLTMATLKLVLPGVPDLYQGTEVWDLSVVDPDNRRPVDFDRLGRLLDVAADVDGPTAWAGADEGLAKLFLIHRLLTVRAARPQVFGAAGGCVPLHATGVDAHRLVALDRAGDVVAIVPRLVRSFPFELDAVVRLPPGSWHGVLDGRAHRGSTAAEVLFEDFPVSVLVKVG